MTTSFDIPPGFTAHVMQNWNGYRGRRALLVTVAIAAPAVVAVLLGVWHVLIIGAFCMMLVFLRSRTRRRAALAALEDAELPRITITLDRAAVTIQSGEHSWSRRHGSQLQTVTETSQAIIMSFTNAITSGIPVAAVDSPRDWKKALDALQLAGRRDPKATLPVDPPGVRGPNVLLPPDQPRISITGRLILLVFFVAGFYFAGPAETIFQFVAGILGYLAGVLFFATLLNRWAYPADYPACDTILTDQGIYLYSGAQDAFCGWQACIDIVDDGHLVHLVGEWGGPFVSLPVDTVPQEFAEFAKARIIETHGSLPSEQEHEHDHEDDHLHHH